MESNWLDQLETTAVAAMATEDNDTVDELAGYVLKLVAVARKAHAAVNECHWYELDDPQNAMVTVSDLKGSTLNELRLALAAAHPDAPPVAAPEAGEATCAMPDNPVGCAYLKPTTPRTPSAEEVEECAAMLWDAGWGASPASVPLAWKEASDHTKMVHRYMARAVLQRYTPSPQGRT